MKLLFLVDQLPHSGSAGGYQIIHQRIIRLARRGHRIGVVCFHDADHPQSAAAEDFRRQVSWLRLVPPPPSDRSSVLRRSIRHGRPWWFALNYSPAMARAVGDMVEEYHFHIAIAEFTTMAQYFLNNPYLSAVRRVVSCHNSPWFGCRRALRLHRFGTYAWSALLFRMAGLKRYEAAVYRNADWVTTLTPADRYWLLTLAPGLDIGIIPAGVDIAQMPSRPVEQTEEAVMFMGRFSDETNVDAILWFSHTVWPQITAQRDQVRLYVVGPEPPPAVQNLQRTDSRITVTGYVNNIRAYLQRARVFVCPVRIGSGMRTKVLEAMASGVPVVSTVLGMEGIPAEPGGNCFLADQPDRFAAYVKLLLTDLDLNREMGRAARRTMEQHFDWERITDHLENGLKKLVPSGSC